ncbi:MAG: HAD family phosphatase, partial [Oscillospiraceae bacterium]|nr:HAD family phosphatase [Oscillospiraceae bacterium]
MNLIFDIGNVLLQFKPASFLEELFPDQNLREKLLQTIFQSPDWLQIDQGLLTHEEATARFCTREPELAAKICQVMEQLPTMLTPMQETVS